MAIGTSQPDPNVKIPAAVQALAAAAQARQEAYIQELAGDVTPLPGDQAFDDGGKVEQPPQPTPPPPLQREPEQQELPLGDEELSYKQKFLSIKGRYDKAQTQLSEMAEQIASMQRSMRDLQMRAQPAEQPAAPTYKKLITPEEEEEFGQEFLDVVGRKAQEILAPVQAAYEMKFSGLEQQVKGAQGFVQQNARDTLEAQMDRDVPNWREVNYQQEFLDWLKLPDPYSGVIRMGTLRAAFEQNDTPRVRAFFRGFLAEEAATTPADYQPGPNPQPANGGTGRVTLESLAAPGRAKTAAAVGAPTEKPVFTRAQVTQFYVDVSAGRFRGRDDERKQIENQIFEAGNSGRIR